MPNETLHAILVDGLGPRWFFIVRGVCRLWRDVADASAKAAVGGDDECLCGAAPERMDDCCCGARPAPSRIPVRASAIVEWTSMRPDLWDPAPKALVTWCTLIGGASEAEAAAVLVASNRPPLVLRAAEMIQEEAAASGGRVLPPTPGWLYSGQTRLTVTYAAFQAALLRGCASTLKTLLDAAPGFLTHDDAGQGMCFWVAVQRDNPDAVEFLLRSGFDPWSGDDAGGVWDVWRMIEDNGAGRVLVRLLDTMAETSSAEGLGLRLRVLWDERVPRGFAGASVPVLNVLLERGYTMASGGGGGGGRR